MGWIVKQLLQTEKVKKQWYHPCIFVKHLVFVSLHHETGHHEINPFYGSQLVCHWNEKTTFKRRFWNHVCLRFVFPGLVSHAPFCSKLQKTKKKQSGNATNQESQKWGQIKDGQSFSSVPQKWIFLFGDLDVHGGSWRLVLHDVRRYLAEWHRVPFIFCLFHFISNISIIPTDPFSTKRLWAQFMTSEFFEGVYSI